MVLPRDLGHIHHSTALLPQKVAYGGLVAIPTVRSYCQTRGGDERVASESFEKEWDLFE